MSAKNPCWKFHLNISRQDGTLQFIILVCRNTREGEKPWRLNVINAADSQIEIPHLSLSEPPTTSEEVSHHLEAQLGLYENLRGTLHIQAA